MIRILKILKPAYIYSALIFQVFAIQVTLTDLFGMPNWMWWGLEAGLILIGSPVIGFVMAVFAFGASVEFLDLSWWQALPLCFPAAILSLLAWIRLQRQSAVPSPQQLFHRSIHVLSTKLALHKKSGAA